MHAAAPHFLLYSEAAAAADAQQALPGRWRFVLRPSTGGDALQAADDEDGATPERLELLAIVRALESLDQPSRVTLVTASRNVKRGLTYGLPLWRESAWQWERYGQMTPVKNGDLWRRIDRALAIHALDCRAGRLEQADDLAQPATAPVPAAEGPKVVTRRTRSGRVLRIDQPAGKSEIHSTKRERAPLVPTLRVGTPSQPLRGTRRRPGSRLQQGATAVVDFLRSWIARAAGRGASSAFRPTRSVGRR